MQQNEKRWFKSPLEYFAKIHAIMKPSRPDVVQYGIRQIGVRGVTNRPTYLSEGIKN